MNSILCRTFRKNYIRILHLKSLNADTFLKCTPKALARYSLCNVYKPNLEYMRSKYTEKRSQSAEVNKYNKPYECILSNQNLHTAHFDSVLFNQIVQEINQENLVELFLQCRIRNNASHTLVI
jgi:hypothetical protein